ncbi:MAG TPA: PTS sugar transporter subunit IIA [Phycisphaerales bacterium]|nr:PTS sugar transporter subunit IIA [Phycisphaerales bacterium]HMP35832.1 PTS sugar transporter subunit IIA [Phycisphaerales bacterium]
MKIIDILSPKAVKVPLVSTAKREAIDELVDLLASAGLAGDPASLKRVVWDRETQRSTGIGEGLAIPHGKCPAIRQLVMAVGRPAQPIDFDSIDRKPVRLVVLLASPPDRMSDHIQALGRISRLMTNATFREATYGAESAEALYRLFEGAEK